MFNPNHLKQIYGWMLFLVYADLSVLYSFRSWISEKKLHQCLKICYKVYGISVVVKMFTTGFDQTHHFTASRSNDCCIVEQNV